MNRLVEQVVRDPDNPPKTVVLLGFLGASSKNGFVRIYPDLDFRTYYELPATAVLFAKQPDPSHEEEPTTIIIDATANVSSVRVVEASFLAGTIASGYVSTTKGNAALWGGPPRGPCCASGHPATTRGDAVTRGGPPPPPCCASGNPATTKGDAITCGGYPHTRCCPGGNPATTKSAVQCGESQECTQVAPCPGGGEVSTKGD
jgi:hypothetical protein